jgi:two-component system chemotaxis response regulator CheB
MGKDGANELKDMKDKGAITVVQNEESSVVFGMPGEALRIGAANQILSPEMIAEIITKSGLKK